MASLFSHDLEKQFLSGTILHPQTRAETGYVTAADFSETNAVVLRAIDACLAGDSPFSAFLLVNMLNSLGTKIGNAIEPGLYIKSLEGIAVPESAVEGIAKKLRQLSIRREMHGTGKKIAQVAEQGAEKKAGELVAELTEIFNSKVNVLAGSGDDEPSDLFGTVGDFLSTETVYDTRSITLPYPTMHDLYGALDIGVTVVCSRMKVGKSTLWLSTLQQLAEADTDDSFRALVLDTELTKEENQSRALSAASGVKEYLIRHKLYRKNRQQAEKVKAAEALLAPLAGRVSHKYVGGMDLNQILTIARRWAFKMLKAGKRGLIVFDYLKLNSSADFAGKNPLFLQVGSKIDALKNLSKELQLPIWAFCQANRSGEDTKEGGRLQNSSIIGGSDMIAQFASNIYLLERLSPEDMKRLCPDLSVKFTHRLIAIATRVLGPDNLGKNRWVKYQEAAAHTRKPVEKWIENYLLMNFDSFNVRECECPTLYDLMERQRSLGIKVTPEVTPEEERAPVL